jgi:SAM-dependent methyltransferase
MDARRHAAESDVAGRVRFEVRTSDAPVAAASADVVFFFEALHDMAHPVAALRTARDALRPGGRVLVLDEAVLDVFTPNGPDLERLYFASSVLHCLPVGLSEPDSAGTGAMLRPDTLRRYATDAGFMESTRFPRRLRRSAAGSSRPEPPVVRPVPAGWGA